MARILVIDTNVAVQAALQQYLTYAGYTVVLASDRESGMRAAREAPVDLFLVSVGLPFMKGIATCKAIKESPALRHVPVVMMTGGRTADVVYTSLTAGALDVLSKPFDYDELKSAISRYLTAHDPRPGTNPSA